MATEERYMEWLTRMDIPVEETTTIERFQDYLREEFEITEPKRIEALWSATDTRFQLAAEGIRAIEVTYPWGKEMRFGWKGRPGLWGWESIKEHMGW